VHKQLQAASDIIERPNVFLWSTTCLPWCASLAIHSCKGQGPLLSCLQQLQLIDWLADQESTWWHWWNTCKDMCPNAPDMKCNKQWYPVRHMNLGLAQCTDKSLGKKTSSAGHEVQLMLTITITIPYYHSGTLVKSIFSTQQARTACFRHQAKLQAWPCKTCTVVFVCPTNALSGVQHTFCSLCSMLTHDHTRHAKCRMMALHTCAIPPSKPHARGPEGQF